MNEVLLNVHTCFSMQRGVDQPEAMCEAAAARGCRFLAFTERDGLYGAVRCFEAARDRGLVPLIGVELLLHGLPTVLLAESPEGYSRICRLVSGYHRHEDFDLIAELRGDCNGVVVLTPLRELALELGAQGYLALSTLEQNTHQEVLWARRNGLTAVALHPVWFAEPEGYALHRLLRAIARCSSLEAVPPGELVSPRACLDGLADLPRMFPQDPALHHTRHEIAERCALREPPWGSLVFPAFGASPEESFRRLREKSLQGLRERYGRLDRPILERLEHELNLIRNKGFADYFLVVEDIVSRSGLTCGRGSAASSIVAYALRITHVDPLRHDLFFERFLNEGRRDPPDIDVDFAWDERDDLLAYVFATYGDQAAMVANHVGFKARAAVREVAKVYGLPEGEIAAVTKRLSGRFDRGDFRPQMSLGPRFRGLELAPPWPEILERAVRLQGLPRYLSVHCGGVVICPGGAERYVPVERSAKGIPVIQWEKDMAEEAGLVKIDLLGNRSLAVVRDCLAALRENYGIELPYAGFNPLHDLRTREAIATARTFGVFYVESPATRQLLTMMHRGDFEHLTVASSLVRPATNKYLREYVRRLHGGEYTPLHPDLTDLLAESCGIMVYHEDVSRVAIRLAGFTAFEADDLRKVISKKHRRRKLEDYRELFLARCADRGYDRAVVDEIWDMIMTFEGYSFCKSHSASYALLSFKACYLKAHYPAEFLAAVVSNGGGYYTTFAYVSEMRRLGLRVLPPDLNRSRWVYRGGQDVVRVGLMQLRGLQRASAEALLLERERGGPFSSLEDLLGRVELPYADVRLLLRAGCLDRIERERSRAALQWAALAYHEGRSRGGASAMQFRVGADGGLPRRDVPSPGDYDEATMLRHEVEALGFLCSRHPLELYRERLRGLDLVPGVDLCRHVGKTVRTLGWFVNAKLSQTKAGEAMEFVAFEDTTAIYDATFFPEAYRRFCQALDGSRPYLLTGRVDGYYGACSLLVSRVELLERPR